MGKASKWLQKFLTRKREDTEEDKEENKDNSFSLEDSVVPTAICPGTPNIKRRWSFGKSAASTDKNNHKTSRSLDAIDSTRLVPLDLLEHRSEQNNGANRLMTFFVAAKYEKEQKFTTSVPMLHNEATYTVVSTPFATAKQFRAVVDAAATKIQAFFRAHLARKALKALKGLVKIQALVRGHLVRKQTSEMLRCMNALMSIQVRARVQRIQMTEEPPITVKRKLTAYDQLRRGHIDNMNLIERRGSLRWNKDLTNHQRITTREHEFSTNYSERISVSKQENQFQVYQNPSPLTDTSCSQFEDFLYGTPKRISQRKYNVSDFNHIKAPESPSVDYSGTKSHNSKFGHNYMANTSSRPNLRSRSEPKERPFKQKTMRSPSFGGIITTPDTRDQYQSSKGSKKQPPWSIKRYRAAKSSKDMEYDSSRT